MAVLRANGKCCVGSPKGGYRHYVEGNFRMLRQAEIDVLIIQCLFIIFFFLGPATFPALIS